MDLIHVECPKCGAGLEITPDNNHVICEYCNNSFLMDNTEASQKDERIHIKGRPFQVIKNEQDITIVFPEDKKTGRTLNITAAGIMIFCILITSLFMDEPYRWAGPFGGAIIMFIMGIICLISAFRKKNTRKELRLTAEGLEWVKLFSGQQRDSIHVSRDEYSGCELIKRPGGRGGAFYQLEITGNNRNIVLGINTPLDKDDVLKLREIINAYYHA